MAVENINVASVSHPSGVDQPLLPGDLIGPQNPDLTPTRILRLSVNDVLTYELKRLGNVPLKDMKDVNHTYQPHREAFLPSTHSRMQMVPWVNFDIDHQVYQPIFETTDLVTVKDESGNEIYEFEYSVPDGIYSYWAPLRDWKMHYTPEGFATAKENINKMKDKEYKILADTYIHLIMPLQPPEDQLMLAEIGQIAFEEDFGFRSKGVWVAETGISSSTVHALYKAGVKFVVLRDSQIAKATHNPMYVEVKDENGNPVTDESGTKIAEMAVFHFNSGLSGGVSFEDHFTENADWFLDDQMQWAQGDISFGSDTELNGHHKKGRDQWRRHLTRPDVLAKHGFGVLDVKARLEDPEHNTTFLVENSSWSCDHELGRWTGEHSCCCGDPAPTPDVMELKSELFQTLDAYGIAINETLDGIDPQWRELFKPFFLGVRKSWFITGDPKADIDQMIQEDRGGLSILLDKPVMRQLFEAKMCEFVGKTSCGWFFSKPTSPERELPSTMIQEIELLIPNVVFSQKADTAGESLVFQKAA